MHKLILFFGLSLVLSSSNLSVSDESFVYICDSTGATKYHLTSNCKGLNACEHKIIKVTKEEAIRQGKKTLCGWED